MSYGRKKQKKPKEYQLRLTLSLSALFILSANMESRGTHNDSVTPAKDCPGPEIQGFTRLAFPPACPYNRAMES